MNPLTLSPADADKLAELIKHVGVAMVTTLGSDGALHSRPMAVPAHGFDGSLWFFTSFDSPKTGEVAAHPQVNAAFAEPKEGTYVSISGPGRVVKDPAKARQLWSPLLKVWFPGGVDDPRLALMQIEVEHAEYWDAESGGMRVFLGLVKSVVTGRPPLDLSEHKRIG
jgi:general stress protein 26